MAAANVLYAATGFGQAVSTTTSEFSVPRIDTELPPATAGALHEAIGELIQAAIPTTYTDDKEWGGTKRIYAGVKVELDGLRIDSERKYKEVNHGSWNRYRMELIDPAKNLEVKITPLVRRPDQRFAFEIKVIATTHVFTRWSQWNYGLQLISLSGSATSKLELDVKGSIGLRLEQNQLVPDLVVDPHVDSAQITLHSFRLQDISDVGGEFAEQMGQGIEHWLKHRLIPEQNAKLADKLNQKIAKKRERLRLSAESWIPDWLSSH